MDDKAIQEAQRRLEEKRESLKQIGPKPIGLGVEVKVGDPLGPCSICGQETLATEEHTFFLNCDIYGPRSVPRNLKCGPCIDAEEAKVEQERQKRMAERDAELEKERRIRRIQQSGIGERFRGITWDDYAEVTPEAAKVKKVCREYADTFQKDSNDIVMVGACGTGKNMLASLIGLHIIWNGFSYQYTTAMRLVRAVKDSWRDKETTEQEVIDSFNRCHLLCIDEIGVQFGSPTEQLFITEVINNRYEEMKPTILISNLTLKQIEEVLGARAVDRFHERGKFLVFNWESYRRRKC